MKLCTDCRWAEKQDDGMWMCHHPRVMFLTTRSP
jgi:hypothetical protein